jgi:teichuronic acid biosynthesis glycosyltransferase TuaG
LSVDEGNPANHLALQVTPPISIIVPAYNVEPFLAETLASIQRQTYCEFEVIVVDDGSTDRTSETARQFVEKDARFILLHQKNAGTAAACNTALKHAGGKWIAFLEADDVWLPEKLAAQLDLLKQEPKANLLFTNYLSWDGQKDLARRYSDPDKFPDGDVGRRLIFFDLFGTSTVMIKREMLNVVGLFDVEVPVGQDWDLWLRIAESGLCAKGVRQPMARYRVWPGQVSCNTIRMCECNVIILEKALARPQRAAWRRDYKRSLQIARGNLELARVRPLIETHPKTVPVAALRAWSHCPTRLKWLLWYFATLRPNSPWAEIVYRKIRRKW